MPMQFSVTSIENRLFWNLLYAFIQFNIFDPVSIVGFNFAFAVLSRKCNAEGFSSYGFLSVQGTWLSLF